jgi:hypothetical protein
VLSPPLEKKKNQNVKKKGLCVARLIGANCEQLLIS